MVVAKIDNAMRLTAVDRKASALGLSAGMALANARAMLPALKAMAANEPADLRLLERIADWCDGFTPFVALDAPDGLLLDVTGAAHLFGGEAAMLDQLRTRLKQQGFAVQAALAGTRVAARALARYGNGTVVPPGCDAAAMAPLPIEALELGAAVSHAFRHAGLKTIAQVASRGRAELTARFGAKMVFTLDAALDRAEEPISPRLPLPDVAAERRFAEPVLTEETILSTLKALGETLSQMLERRGEGARRLDAAFFRADGAVRRIAVETGAPTRDPAVIERLFREKLGALADPIDPGFGFDLIRLGAPRTERCAPEALGFHARAEEEKQIRLLADRLGARFGAHRVIAFQPGDTHIPEAGFLALPAQYAKPAKRTWEKIRKAQEAPRRPLRLFASPEPIDVSQTETSFGFRWRRARHVATRLEGPERIAMEWWRHQTPAPSRDYFRLEDEEGRRFWLYREETRWFLHGVFA